jgi:hypothetical protein
MPTIRSLLVCALLPACSSAFGAEPAIFRDADLALGARLLVEHRCQECHARHMGGAGDDIYNPVGRIRSAAQLRGMVEACNTQLKLQLFPEEVTAVSAVLNRRHYQLSE